ncbi:hypothetical protein R1flu_020574 [Riccia fluitans]|uniref:Uncharacterized protein n=1 Tax=Riccia fluitans TaxID=41844 RepID=A0ABD1ZP08_9MARC
MAIATALVESLVRMIMQFLGTPRLPHLQFQLSSLEIQGASRHRPLFSGVSFGRGCGAFSAWICEIVLRLSSE